MLTATQGKALIKLARKSIEGVFSKKKPEYGKEKKSFSRKQGVFVTLLKMPGRELRGCVGFPYPVKPLADAVADAAKTAAFSDGRFPPVEEKELKRIMIEISVLTEPELFEAEHHELPNLIKTGKDGLIVQFSGFSGLLLPQVATEQKWSSLEFLRGTCIKAGLPAETWLNPACRVYRFQAQIFDEK